jgi:large subunit ribosomal protein L32e
MTKNEIVEEFAKLEDVNTTIAEALYNAGYTTIEKLKGATIGELTKIEGITKNTARSIRKQLNPEEAKKKEEEAKIEKDEVEKETKEGEVKEEKKIEKKEEVEIVEEEEEKGYSVAQKPELSSDIKKKLKLKKDIKNKTPHFKRQQWFAYRRVGDSWRRPRGIHSKQRHHLYYRTNVVSVGYRTPKEVRGLHPSGFKEVLIHTINDLNGIDPKKDAVRIAHSVGARKRAGIEEKADELGIRVLNRRT